MKEPLYQKVILERAAKSPSVRLLSPLKSPDRFDKLKEWMKTVEVK